MKFLTLTLFKGHQDHRKFSGLKFLKWHKLSSLSLADMYHECRYTYWWTTQHTSTGSVWPLTRSQQQQTFSIEINGISPEWAYSFEIPGLRGPIASVWTPKASSTLSLTHLCTHQKSWACFLAVLIDSCISFSYFSMVRLQVSLGLLRLLFPWGVQMKGNIW